MANMPKTFKQADFERAVRAARAVDLPIYRTEIRKDGTLVLLHFNEVEPAPAIDDQPNPWDEVLG